MKFLKTFLAAVLLVAAALFAQFAVQASEVNSDEELINALRDESVETITINYQNANLTEFVTVSRNLTIDGRGAVLNAENGICLTFAQGTSATFRDIVLTGETDFAVKSYGSVSLEGTVEFAGGYGLLLNNGAALHSNAILVSRTENRIAIAANTNGGEVTIGNLNINDTTTSGVLLYIYRGGGTLRFMGNNSLVSAYGTAVRAAEGREEEQTIVLDSFSSVTAQSENASADNANGAAFNVRECTLILKKSSQLNAKGSYAAIYCDALQTEADCVITAENAVKSNGSGAVTVFGSVSDSASVSIGEKNNITLSGSGGLMVYKCSDTSIGSNSMLKISSEYGGVITSYGGNITLGDKVALNGYSAGWGISAKGVFSCGTDCDIIYDASEGNTDAFIEADGGINIGSYSVASSKGARKGLVTEEAVSFGEYSTFECSGAWSAIYTSKGLQSAKGCMISIKNAAKYGIYSTGTLLANTVNFGEENTVNITSDSNGIYACEAVIFNKGCKVNIMSGKDMPAIWVNTDLTSQGYLRITNSEVNITSAITADGGEAAVNVVGSVIAEDGSRLNVETGGFGILCRAGDIIVGTDSAVYLSGGCAAFVEEGNVRISQAGKLYAKGTLDSGVRISNGMLHVGKESTIITEGERFGAEILASGGIWLENPKLFDFRSTTAAAIYIEEGVFNAANTSVLSAWYRKEGKTNSETWWNTDMSKYKAWEINSKLTKEQMNYADYTQREVNGTARFMDGTEVSSEGFVSNVSSFSASAATRISAFMTRPVSSANYLFIPAGRSFSWRLDAESVEGMGEIFELIGEPKSGTASLSKDGVLTYSASESTRGEQTVVYQVTALDGAVSLPVEVTINVTRSKPPAAYNHTFDVLANGSLIDTVTATDFDGTIASLTVTKQPEHGTLSLGSDGTINYTPEGTYVGLDSFCYTALDNDSDQSNEATVTLLVGMKGETTARNATYIAAKNEETVGKLAVDLPKDTSLDYINITVFPQYGTLVVDGNSFVYTPPENFAGTETFGYKAVNEYGIKSNEAYVSIITVPSEKPAANSLKIDCAAGKAYSGKLSAQDLDGKITTYMIDVYPKHGEFSFDASNGKFTYTAESGYIGTDSFTFYVYDDEGLKSEVASVTISVDTYLNILKASGELTKIIIAAIIVLAVLITLIVIIVTGTIRKRRKLDREYEEQYGSYDDYYGF